MARVDAPFTNFLIAMAHSGMSFEEFIGGQDDEALIEIWGITAEQLAILRGGTLADIQAEVQRELGNTSAVAQIWVGVVPWPWIGSA